MAMEVEHTHPEYESPEKREENLQDLWRDCIAAVSALRGSVHKHSA